jgi:hypothetical protein
MALVCTNTGEIAFLQYILNISASSDKLLHLYTSDVTPTETTTIGSGAGQLTECTVVGYTLHTLTSAGWTTTQDGSGTTTGIYSQVTFTFSTNVDLYGYYVTTTSGTLLWAERFSGAPFSFPIDGGSFGLTNVLGLD